MTNERAILAGGCFWGMQALLRRYPGVISTRVGYSGGEVANATYRNHGRHAEAVEIIFNPAKTSYRTLLEFFFQIHDPSTRDRQGNDRGPSYRSAIYYTSDEQRKIAEETIADVDASGLWPGKVVTEVVPAGDFWEAEPEHQDYLERFPTAIPATSCGPTGSSRGVAPTSPESKRWSGLAPAEGPVRQWFGSGPTPHLTLPSPPRPGGEGRVRSGVDDIHDLACAANRRYRALGCLQLAGQTTCRSTGTLG